MAPHRSVDELLVEAMRLDAGPQRDAFIEHACSGDVTLERDLRDLISATEEAGTFLSLPGGALGSERQAASAREEVGTQIGRYTLLETLGEGGFGVVYLAEQTKPLRRHVALKILKPGMDSAAVIARFEAERQALALMDHPCVTKVFDAGTTPEGRPYFVMEPVHGLPILEHCDQHRLGINERIRLSIRVCEAVQHAHAKGLIHRDLKPSNILVEYDGSESTPKVIDFGIARALDYRLTEQTIHTARGQLIGTPQYMSPEQASGLDIDTRSDVYSLGVVLYELLVGATPFDAHALRNAGYAEMQRIIVESEPPKASTRLSRQLSAPAASSDGVSIIEARSADAATLDRALRRDLDWILAKSLEKDRDRRYETPHALAMDLRRYLDNEPVVATPPSVGYRVQKFVRRNRAAVVAAAIIVVVLFAGLAGTTYEFIEADGQRRRADARADELQHVADFQSSMLAQIDPTAAGFRLTEDVNRRFAEALETVGVEGDRTAQMDSFRRQWGRVNATDTALTLIDETILKPAVKAIDERFANMPLVDARLRQVLAQRYRELGLYGAAAPLQTAALETRRRLLGEEHPDTVRSRANLGFLHWDQGRYAEAEAVFIETMAIRQQALGPEHAETLALANALAGVYWRQERYDEAESLYRKTLEARRRVLGDEHPDTAVTWNALAYLHKDQGRIPEAVALLVQVLEIKRRVLGDDDPSTLGSMSNLGMIYTAAGRYAEAEPPLIEALEARRRLLGSSHPDTLSSLNNLGMLYWRQDRLDEAEPLYVEALELRRRVLTENHPETVKSISNLAILYARQGRHDDALVLRRELFDLQIAAAARSDANAFTLNGAAWLLLTFEVESLRDPPRALAFAQRACAREEAKGGVDLVAFLDTLAMAQYANGDVASAVESQRRVLSLMPENDIHRAEVEQALAKYEAALSEEAERDGGNG